MHKMIKRNDVCDRVWIHLRAADKCENVTYTDIELPVSPKQADILWANAKWNNLTGFISYCWYMCCHRYNPGRTHPAPGFSQESLLVDHVYASIAQTKHGFKPEVDKHDNEDYEEMAVSHQYYQWLWPQHVHGTSFSPLLMLHVWEIYQPAVSYTKVV